jgi:hypothetical protein
LTADVDVRFYLDPICPWCWVTSRWLTDNVAPERGLVIDWRTISLYFRNLGRDFEPAHREAHRSTVPVMRVIEALRADGRNDDVATLYRELGLRIHHQRQHPVDLAAALTAANLEPELAEAATDDSWDAAIRESTDEAEAIAGDDVGTPIIAIETDEGWRGYFGPIIDHRVTGPTAGEVWDATVVLIRTPGFYELKRTRDVPLELPDLV